MTSKNDLYKYLRYVADNGHDSDAYDDADVADVANIERLTSY